MNNKEIAEKVVNRILETVAENGILPWVKPWNNAVQKIRISDGYVDVTIPPCAWNRNGIQYSGANTYLPVGEYITFKQCQKEGGKVKKGARGFPVVYWNFFEKETGEIDENGDKKKEKIPVLKYYTVFRIEDCEGIEQKHHPAPVTVRMEKYHYAPVSSADLSYDETAESIIHGYITRENLPLERENVSNRAFYSPSEDKVEVPCRAQYSTHDEYYSTLFHELAHSTGHKNRLNRFSGKDAIAAFGDEAYSKEELVAEITAASVLSAIGLETGNSFRNSAAYVKSWASQIKENPLMYVSAASKAQAAFNMLFGLEK